MVKRVTVENVQREAVPHGAVFLQQEQGAFVDSLMNLCSGLPWEHMVRFGSGAAGAVAATRRAPPKAVAPPPPKPAPAPKPAPPLTRPGCTAADSALLNLSYLEGLSRGLGGFGVLRVGRERLEEGAKAAQQLGQANLAGEMRAIAQELPRVRDASAAAALAEKLRPVADQAWSLGASCKGAMTSQQLAGVRHLARQVKDGKLSMEEAVSQVKGA